jgi:hypothetical protein
LFLIVQHLEGRVAIQISVRGELVETFERAAVNDERSRGKFGIACCFAPRLGLHDHEHGSWPIRTVLNMIA